MDWEEHKQLAESSRRLIAFPFFLEALSSAQSPCLDIGCGTADLTEIVAKRLNFSIVGVDKSISIEDRRRCVDSDVHLVEADITKNGVLETGTSYNSAFSNCCFCHLNDDQLITSLADLFNTMNTDGKFVFLVPSISWARSLYQDIEYVSSGITAIPRSGERQFFRTPNWYASALQKAGFVNIETFEVLIPNDERLDRRYLERAGQPIFSAFIAYRGEFIPDLALRTKAFDVAHDNRKLEIQLFWQRSLFFWGFVAASLVGYAQTIKDFPQYSIVFSLFGLVCSIVWSRGNRGSKYWQEYWEKKVNFFQHFTTGNIFYDRKPTSPGFFEIFEGRRASVSKLTMALSDFSIFVWALLCALTFTSKTLLDKYWTDFSCALVIATLLYCWFFLATAKSED